MGGCFWACPNGVILLDFTNPMQETPWVDLIDVMDGGYEKYDDLDFVRWENADIILRASELLKLDGEMTTKTIEITISKAEYTAWLAQAK